MTQEEWLLQYIEAAFAGVTLDGGIDIYAAQSMADYGNPHEDRRSELAERNDWRQVPLEDLSPRFCAIVFLDFQGLRFYAPAIMTALLQIADTSGLLLEFFVGRFHVTRDGLLHFAAAPSQKHVHFRDVFNDRQRAAIIRFLKYLAYNTPGEAKLAGIRGGPAHTLAEIQSRT